MCVEASVDPKKMHRSVTAKMFLPDMFLRSDTRNRGTCAILTGISCVRQDAKRDRAPRWRWIVDGFCK